MNLHFNSISSRNSYVGRWKWW